MSQRKKIQDTAAVECYRMSTEDLADLRQWLEETEGVEELKNYHRKGSGAVEFGELIGVTVVGFLAQYAGTKVLDFVYDELKTWMKARKKRPFLITLQLNGKTKRIGKGKPKRYRRRG
jgi:hypothetical protein